MSDDVPDQFIPDTHHILGELDLPVCPGCSKQVGPDQIQHTSAVLIVDGDSWHRWCAEEVEGADHE